MARRRLDKLLVKRGLVANEDLASALVMAGKVLVNGQPSTKAGTMIADDAEVSLKEVDHPYVSRGALKLIKALDEFSIDVQDKVAMDVGSSTGGFTDVMLTRGAQQVFAIDVGYGQLDWKLRNDERVVVLERENIRYLDAEKITAPCDLATIDVSFISLSKVLPKVSELLGPGKTIVALIKPQFEVAKGQVGKGGVVRDESVRKQCIENVQTFARSAGLSVGAVAESPIRGPAGNVEFLQHLTT
jgi:23S rRNA (cytidine1920-2'-O)/16S rRNA (cytidine1409-2'-O)-methyltransferase